MKQKEKHFLKAVRVLFNVKYSNDSVGMNNLNILRQRDEEGLTTVAQKFLNNSI